MKLSEKKFSITFVVTLIVLLVTCICWVIVIDPFVYYHKPLFGLHTIKLKEGYQNSGFIRNWDYETAIVGTSMTEQIRASEVDEMFNTKTIKICSSGAYTLDIAMYLKAVCEEGKAKQIILGLDANYFKKPSDTYRYVKTKYMFDKKNLFGDVQYLLNKDVVMYNCIKMLLENVKMNYMDLDDFYILSDDYFSKSITLESYSYSESEEDYSQVGANIDNILSIIQDNSDMQFYIFMPPYSILYWNTYYMRESAQEELSMHQEIMESFLECENVKFYYFMDDQEIITDLDNYRDAGHYNTEVCSNLIRMMVDGEHLITKDNYLIVLNDMSVFVENYPYEEIFQD